MDRGAVVEAYWRHHCDSTSQVSADRLRADETRWAWEAVEQHVADANDDVVDLLCALADAASDDKAYLGAGPIEELLGAHSSRFGDVIEAAARRDVRFRTALRCALFEGKVDAERAGRLRRFGQPL